MSLIVGGYDRDSEKWADELKEGEPEGVICIKRSKAGDVTRRVIDGSVKLQGALTGLVKTEKIQERGTNLSSKTHSKRVFRRG